MSVGKQIRQFRKEAGLTQKQLGEKCGIAEPTIRKYELGMLNPKIETLTKIANALQINISAFNHDGIIYFNNVPDKPIEKMTIEDAQKALEMAEEVLNKFHDNLIDVYIGNDDFILSYYNKLNSKGKKEALKRIRELTLINEYTNKEE